ncbi:MAG: protoporphyrinogen oxidase [Blastocatellia bacterium]|nr:protoporphyrinogen oxidase [Blastocatellia bacterium]
MATHHDTIVIGAGITGLVASYKLCKQGQKVALLEASDRVGGVIRSEQKQGFLVEYGPNSFLESGETTELITELGLNEELVSANPKAPRYIYFRDRLEAVPMSPPALIATRLLSVKGKLRLLSEPFVAPRRFNDEEESLASFVCRRFGQEVHDRLFSPFVSGVYAGNTELLSASACFPKLTDLEKEHGSLFFGMVKTIFAKREAKKAKSSSRLSSFRSGMQTLPHRLAEKIGNSLLLSAKIEKINISQQSPKYSVEFVRDGQRYSFTSDNLIVATPTKIVVELLGDQLPELSKELETIEYTRLAVIHLSFKVSDIARSLNGFGFLIPRGQSVRTLGTIWNSSLFPNRAPEGEVLFTSFIGGAHDLGAVELRDEELVAIVSGELKKILSTSADAKLISLWKWQKAIPQYCIGHVAKLKRIEAAVKGQKGLYLAGNYLQGVSVPDCVSRAIKIAEDINKTTC